MSEELEQPAGMPDSGADTPAAGEHQAAPQDDDLPEGADPNGQPPEEEEEVELGDVKLALPKSVAEKVKAGVLMQQDYTRKTQEVAETRKAVEAEREQLKQTAEQQQKYLHEVAEVVAIDRQLAEYQKLDWQALSDQDPVGAQKLHFQYQALQQQRQAAVQNVTQKQQQALAEQQQNLAKQVQEADAYFKREIPGWSDERSTRLQQFAVEQGLPADKLAMAVIQNPALAKVLHKAELFDQMEKKQRAKPNTPAPAPAPVTRVGASRATAAKDPEKMSTDEWMAWRNEQLRKKR